MEGWTDPATAGSARHTGRLLGVGGLPLEPLSFLGFPLLPGLHFEIEQALHFGVGLGGIFLANPQHVRLLLSIAWSRDKVAVLHPYETVIPEPRVRNQRPVVNAGCSRECTQVHSIHGRYVNDSMGASGSGNLNDN
jgi:hypothetical protein